MVFRDNIFKHDYIGQKNLVLQVLHKNLYIYEIVVFGILINPKATKICFLPKVLSEDFIIYR